MSDYSEQTRAVLAVADEVSNLAMASVIDMNDLLKTIAEQCVIALGLPFGGPPPYGLSPAQTAMGMKPKQTDVDMALFIEEERERLR